MKNEVNIVSFNSSQFSGSVLHCHLELTVPSTKYVKR